KTTRRRKFWGRFCGLVLLGWVYFTFFHFNKDHRNYDHYLHNNVDNIDSIDSIDTTTGSDMNNGGERESSCSKHMIDWTAPSPFSTDAPNFQLRFGKGSFGSKVKLHQGQVSQPTLLVSGKISPMDNKDGSMNSMDSDTKIVDLGLHIEIKESKDLFEAFIWFEDRIVHDGHNRYRACASLEIDIIFPDSLKRYKSVVIDGAVTSILTYDLNIAFDKLDFSSQVGDLVSKGYLAADELKLAYSTGKIEIESVQVASEDKPLNVDIHTNTGKATVNVETAAVSKDEQKEHRILVTAQTGAVVVDVRPKSTELPEGKKAGDLDIYTRTNTGAVRNTISLANEEQALRLSSRSSTGSVGATVSDAFVGRFYLQTSVGSTRVKAAEGSESKIEYEKQTSQTKTGVKGGKESENHGSIELHSSVGAVTLEFLSQ
ncbi:hypothetical protein BGZ54_004013, partial [Gamsiella multidivaricata]